jgi:hypothetical protein
MKTINYLIITIACTLFFACGPGEGEDASSDANGPEMVPEATEPFPRATLQQIAESGTYIDYIFHDFPISFSQTERNAIRQVVGFIDPEPTHMPVGCEPTAMIAFLVDGDILAEGDVYFMDDCSYFVFYDDERNPTYSHPLRSHGKDYYKSVLEQYFDAVQQQPQ